MKNYKILITTFDVIATALLIAGIFLSQYENENYYNINIIKRNVTIHIANNILKGKLFQFDTYFVSNPNYTTFPSLNITESNCNYFPSLKIYNYSNFDEIDCRLDIDDYCRDLRYILLITTLISIPFLVLSKYCEFMRNFESVAKVKGINIYHY